MLRSGLPCEVGESGRGRRIVEGRVVAATAAPTCGELVRRFRAVACPTDAELRLRREALAKGGDIGVAEATERAQRRAGLTQEELVARCGLSVEGLRKIERDRAVPQPDTLGILVRALDLSAADARLLRRAEECGRVARASGHNLKDGPDGIPAPLDRFVGRATLVAALTDLLAPGHGGWCPAHACPCRQQRGAGNPWRTTGHRGTCSHRRLCRAHLAPRHSLAGPWTRRLSRAGCWC